MSSANKKIVIIGAGIIGASIAYHLARRGATVTVIDRGNAAGGATGQSFSWLNASSTRNKAYIRLRQRALEEYRRLQDEFAGALPLKWNGTLIWRGDAASVNKRVSEQTEAGLDIRIVEREEIARLEPNLQTVPELAAFAPGEGVIEPVEATQLLLKHAAAAGAGIRMPAKVEALIERSGRLAGVRLADEILEADAVVMAAGAASAELCAPFGIPVPVEASPAVLAQFSAPSALINSVIVSPQFEIRQVSQNTIAAAAEYAGNLDENGPLAVADTVLAKIRENIAGSDAIQFRSVGVGWRPIPQDGLPIIGFSQQVAGLYLAVTHSGMTLAPAIGRFAEYELLEAGEEPLLDICRPSRFA
ncbi:NAD(P)/FAD-dependent oxidoreductase [Hoeflea prorocentri]|uniref:FAD-dependent oxidoreductase n=1 Tax=Hoeflea prorocentri TaxID=1922333 RepID=A0A9X3ZFC5_9HYPH|nr:FAD-dependent oxidoreductase [Hoeflea prorocentri]MCY6379497.1 FAD-dependent oxidoreductase [Hoeflea prorocentri]MDA5397297.1 FAD-dependent oxidoreductase [Hoeflea prorocentri]